jgi:tape measure domain-containing protein
MDETLKFNIEVGDAELRNLRKNLDDLKRVKAFAALKDDTDAAKRAMAEAQAHVRKLAVEIAAAGKPSADLVKEFDRATAAAKKAQTVYQKTRADLKASRTVIQAMGVDTKNLEAAQKRFSAAVDDSNKSLSAMARLGMQNYRDVGAEIKKLEAAYQHLKSTGKLTAKELQFAKLNMTQQIGELRRFDSALTQTKTRAKEAAAGFKAVKATMGGLLAAAAGSKMFDLAGDIFMAGERAQSMERSFSAATGTMAKANEELDWLRKTARNMGLSFYDSADAYKGMLAAAQDTAAEGEGVRKIFEGIGMAVSATNKTSDEANGIFLALSQMLSKGVVSAEELRGQLAERLPDAINLSAKAMGVTTGEFNKMMESGEILATDLLPKLADAFKDKYAAQVQEAAKGGTAALNALKDAYTDLLKTAADSGLTQLAIAALTRLKELLQDPAVINNVKNWSASIKNIFTTITTGIELVSKPLSFMYKLVLDIGDVLSLLDWVGGLLKGKDAADKTAQATKDMAQTMKQEAAQAYQAIQAVPEALGDGAEAHVSVELDQVDEAQDKIADLTKDETKRITIITETKEARANGGRVGMARGGRFPGDSKRDSIPVLARPGEGFVRNEALAVWDRMFGTGFFEGVNNPQGPQGRRIIDALASQLPRHNVTRPPSPPAGFAAGGRVGQVKDMGKVDLVFNRKAYPVTGTSSVIDQLKAALARERLMSPQ